MKVQSPTMGIEIRATGLLERACKLPYVYHGSLVLNIVTDLIVTPVVT